MERNLTTNNMAITITVGEPKTQEVKPFPKLMISKIGQILYAQCLNPNDERSIVGMLIHTNGYAIDEYNFSQYWCAYSFTDYNQPITLQNV
jgi:hypothetical protein